MNILLHISEKNSSNENVSHLRQQILEIAREAPQNKFREGSDFPDVAIRIADQFLDCLE